MYNEASVIVLCSQTVSPSDICTAGNVAWDYMLVSVGNTSLSE